MLDSLNKRINFLNEVTEMLGLTKINTVHGRAEDYAKQKGYRESFDFCVSRAVANLSTLSEYCIPFVKQGGCFISYKSGSVDQELIQAEKAVKILGGQREGVDVAFSLRRHRYGQILCGDTQGKTNTKEVSKKGRTSFQRAIRSGNTIINTR